MFDVVVGLETRGFFLGLVISQHYKIPFVPIRKKGRQFYFEIFT